MFKPTSLKKDYCTGAVRRASRTASLNPQNFSSSSRGFISLALLKSVSNIRFTASANVGSTTTAVIAATMGVFVLGFSSIFTGINFIVEDSVRGTFSQRHAVLSDTRTGAEYVPLNAVAAGGALQVEGGVEICARQLGDTAVLRVGDVVGVGGEAAEAAVFVKRALQQ